MILSSYLTRINCACTLAICTYGNLTMKHLVDGTWNHLLFPLIVISIVAMITFAVRSEVRMAYIESRAESHYMIPQHERSAIDINILFRDIEGIKKSIEGITREQHQVNLNIEDKLEHKANIIIEKIDNLKREFDKEWKRLPHRNPKLLDDP